MGALEEACRCAVSCDCVIVFSLSCEGMPKGYPSRREPRIHKGGFTVCLVNNVRWHNDSETYLKYLRASPHLRLVKYHMPTTYHVSALSGSRSTRSCASMNSELCILGIWYMHAICKGMVGAWTDVSSKILRSSVRLCFEGTEWNLPSGDHITVAPTKLGIESICKTKKYVGIVDQLKFFRESFTTYSLF